MLSDIQLQECHLEKLAQFSFFAESQSLRVCENHFEDLRGSGGLFVRFQCGMISQLPQFFDIAGFTAKGKDIDHSHMVKQRDAAAGKILGSA